MASVRWAIGCFGLIAGAIVVALVARYGYVTSDNEIDGAIVAFFFAVIAIGGIAGPAVAVHLFRATDGSAKLWGLLAGFIALVALGANLSNSLGAIANRADKTLAERSQIAETAKDNRALLERLTAKRDALPAFTPISDEAVSALREAVNVAEGVRADECKRRGNRCRDREADERKARDALTAALANQALGVEAKRLDAQIADVRAKLETAKPVVNVNPLADALGRIFALPSEMAATWQQIATVVVVELLIAFSLIAFELLRVSHHPVTAEKQVDKPETVQTPLIEDKRYAAYSVREFMLTCLKKAKGQRASWGDIYARYRDWCLEQSPRLPPVGVQDFGEEFGAACETAGIKVEGGKKLYALGVRLS